MLGADAGVGVEVSPDETCAAIPPVAIAASAAVPIVAVASFHRGYRRLPVRIVTPVAAESVVGISAGAAAAGPLTAGAAAAGLFPSGAAARAWADGGTSSASGAK